MVELRFSSLMSRLSSWIRTAIRGYQQPADLALCLAVQELEGDTFLFALCQDLKLRMWSFRVSPAHPEILPTKNSELNVMDEPNGGPMENRA